jgi:hypothetical protein
MAAANADFDRCLLRLGFNQATIEYFRSEELGSSDDLARIALYAMDRVYKQLNKPDNFPLAAAGARRVG